MAHRAPAPNLQESLEGLPYPASKQDIVVCAKAHHAAPAILDLLQRLPDQRYENISAIGHVLGEIEEDLPETGFTHDAVGGSQELEDESQAHRSGRF